MVCKVVRKLNQAVIHGLLYEVYWHLLNCNEFPNQIKSNLSPFAVLIIFSDMLGKKERKVFLRKHIVLIKKCNISLTS